MPGMAASGWASAEAGVGDGAGMSFYRTKIGAGGNSKNPGNPKLLIFYLR